MNLFPEVVALVMAECVIVRCELRYDCMSFEYVAVSPHFEVCSDFEAPNYEACLVKVTEGGGSEIRFEGFRPVNRIPTSDAAPTTAPAAPSVIDPADG